MDYKKRAMELFLRDRYAIDLTGVEILEIDELYAKCRLVISDKHMNNHDTVMGGAIFTLADFTFGCAANTPAVGCVTLSANINFMREARGPVLYAESKCVKNGRNVCFFIITVTDGDGKIIAEAQFNGFRGEPRAADYTQ